MNKASLNYLLEFSVIDSQKREAYLNKLLSRKNASGQKNVQLLKIIYRLIDSDRINDWDADAICKEMQIKNGELDTLKSRLLADYRKFVFGWEEIEKSLKENFNGSDLEFDFVKARKMNAIGMKKEMKTFHLNFLSQIDKDKKELMKNFNLNQSQLFLYEFESTEALANYYYIQRNYSQFLSFFNKLEIFYKSKNKYKLSEAEEAILNIKIFLTRAYKHIFKLISDKNYNSALNNLYAAYEIVKEYDNEFHRYGIPLFIALILFRLNNYDKLQKLCVEIISKAEKEGKHHTVALAKSYLILIEFNGNKGKRAEAERKIKECYEICTDASMYSSQTFMMIKYYVHIMSYSDEIRNTDSLMKHALANAVMSGNKSFTMLTYYQIENEKIFGKILKFENTNELMPLFVAPETSTLDDFQKVLANIMLNMKENISPHILCNIYITYLYTIFLKESEPDLEYVENIKGKINRMLKTRNIAIDLNLFNSVALAFQMQEDFFIIKKAEFLDKHIFRCKNLCDEIMKGNKDSLFSVSAPYSILYTMAKRIKSQEVWDVLKKYDWREQ